MLFIITITKLPCLFMNQLRMPTVHLTWMSTSSRTSSLWHKRRGLQASRSGHRANKRDPQASRKGRQANRRSNSSKGQHSHNRPLARLLLRNSNSRSNSSVLSSNNSLRSRPISNNQLHSLNVSNLLNSNVSNLLSLSHSNMVNRQLSHKAALRHIQCIIKKKE